MMLEWVMSWSTLRNSSFVRQLFYNSKNLILKDLQARYMVYDPSYQTLQATEVTYTVTYVMPIISSILVLRRMPSSWAENSALKWLMTTKDYSTF